MSPNLRPTTCPIPIPTTLEKQWDDMNSFERWRHSPLEHEPAEMYDIANAIAQSDLPADEGSTSPSKLARSKRRKVSQMDQAGRKIVRHLLLRRKRAKHPLCQLQRALASRPFLLIPRMAHSDHSAQVLQARKIAADDEELLLSYRRADSRMIRSESFRVRSVLTPSNRNMTGRGTRSLSIEKWKCALLGPVLTDQESGHKKCVYCDLHHPSSDHLDSHNHRQCEDKGLDASTSYRKDHLRQHLRLMHACEMTAAMDSWKSIAVSTNSRCGFCAQQFSVWQERADHPTAHFKAGARMSECKERRRLDPAIAAQVTNAMPPHLIGIESVSLNPFSASNRASWRQGQELGDGTKPKDPHSLYMEDAHCGHAGVWCCWHVARAECWPAGSM